VTDPDRLRDALADPLAGRLVALVSRVAWQVVGIVHGHAPDAAEWDAIAAEGRELMAWEQELLDG
jgi:hypothetical protein